MFRETPYYEKLDDVLRQLGDFGAFNIRNFTLLLFTAYFSGMYAQIFVFEALDIDYRCKIEECEDVPDAVTWMKFAIPRSDNDPTRYSRCKRYAAKSSLVEGESTCTANKFSTSKIIYCDQFVYNERTAVSDFDLGCRDSTKALIAASHNAGLFLSIPLAGYLSQKYGRKWMLSLSPLMHFTFGLVRSFSINFYMLLIFEFLEAGFGAGSYSTAFVFAMEIVGPENRVIASTIINSFYIFGTVSLGGMAWILHDWRILLRVLYTPSVLLISYIWILDESVRWLLTKGRNAEAIAILLKAAKMNKVTLAKNTLTPLSGSVKSESTDKSLDQLSNNSLISDEQLSEKPEKSPVKEVLQSGSFLKTMGGCSLLWFTCTFIYYGLTINSVYIAGNKYLNFVMVEFVEIPAYFAVLILLQKYGRRKVITLTFLIAFITFVIFSIIPKGYSRIRLTAFLSAKFIITMAYMSIYLFVSDLVPAHLRQFLLAICSSSGRFGTFFAPFTPLLVVFYFNLPAMLFGTLAGAAVFTITVALNTVYIPDEVLEKELQHIPSNTIVCSGVLFHCEMHALFCR